MFGQETLRAHSDLPDDTGYSMVNGAPLVGAKNRKMQRQDQGKGKLRNAAESGDSVHASPSDQGVS